MYIYERDTENRPARPVERPRSWHAVSIVTTDASCPAAIACAGKRYLPSEAPRLPLQGCRAGACECRYRHFEDRRAKPRRLDERAGIPQRPAPVERRAQPSRREEMA